MTAKFLMMFSDRFISIFIKTGIVIFIFFLIFSSCKKKDDFITDPSFKLDFSTDSIVFDTVFSTVGSITKQLKVYNNNKQNVKISSIQLSGGNSSNYRINIDGSPTTSLTDVEIAGNDSLYIFIKVIIDPNDENSPFVVDDKIVFITNGNQQDIDLVAWGQNAYYIIADTYVQGFPPYKIVAHEFSDTTWDNQKPFLIYGYAVVDSNAILRIDAGAKIHFHNNSGLWVYKGGSIKVNGTLDFPVTFQGDRRDMDYRELPGQWDRIWLNEGSIDNEINYAIIKNGFIGIQAETLQEQMGNQLILTNTIIENMSGMGLFTRFYNISANNNVIANCGTYTLAITMGGNYDFRQCTFANYYNYSIRLNPALYLNNFYYDTQGVSHTFDLNAFFGNCINYGRNDEEMQFDEESGSEFVYKFDHCLLKTELNISAGEHFINCLKNEDPLFVDYEINNYELDTLSPAIDVGSLSIAETVPYDILGISRLESPDLGAYEFVPGQ